MIPEIFRISIFEDFSIPIFSFGLMMLLCFLGSMILLQSCLKEAGENPMLAEPMVTYAAIGGVIGARFFSIISYPNQLMEDPIGVIFSSAGFVFYGGFIGGFIAVFILLRKNKIPFLNFEPLTCMKMYIRGLHDGDGNVKRANKKGKWSGGEFRFTNNNLEFQTNFFNWIKKSFKGNINLRTVLRKSGEF